MRRSTASIIAQPPREVKPLSCLTCGHVGEAGDDVGEYYYHGRHQPAEPYCQDIDACERRRTARRSGIVSDHTPGPWAIVRAVYPADPRISLTADELCDIGIRDQGGEGRVIAECFYRVGDREYRPVGANARLIAAAPELLRALIDLTGYLYATQNPGTLPAEWDSAQDAIAKATGESRQI